MAAICMNESDPGANIERFLTDDSVIQIAGTVAGGRAELFGILTDALMKMFPTDRLLIIDREFLSDNDVTFARELEKALSEAVDQSVGTMIVLCDDLPVVGWMDVLQRFKSEDVRIYCLSLGCKNVPMCLKL